MPYNAIIFFFLKYYFKYDTAKRFRLTLEVESDVVASVVS